MIPVKSSDAIGVWVQVVGLNRWPEACEVEDINGARHTTRACGPYSIFDDRHGKGRMGVFARVVEHFDGDIVRVKLRDGLEITVRLESERQWELQAA